MSRQDHHHSCERSSVPTGQHRAPGRTTLLARPIEPWAIFVFVFAIVGAALGFQLWTGRQAVRDTEVARLQDASRYVSENISRQLRGLNEALTRLASDYRTTALTASGEDVSRQLSLLSSAVQSVRGVAIYDGNGNAVASSQSDEVGRDFFAGDFFSEIRKDPGPEVLYLSQRGAIEGRPRALYLSRARFNSDGQFSGIVSANHLPRTADDRHRLFQTL